MSARWQAGKEKLLGSPHQGDEEYEDDKKLSASEHEALIKRWQGGLSPRFREDYGSWLQSGSMNVSLLEGNIYFHPSLLIGKGAAAEVYLGIQPSDGREVAVKILEVEDDENDLIAKHFEELRSTLKCHAAIPGMVQYINSFERTFKGRRKKMREMVVVLELMEGSVADAMRTWKENHHVGTLAHLEVIRYVSVSLLHTLANLHHRQSKDGKDLVHPDVKPDSIMLDHLGQIRLADSGFAKFVDKKADHLFEPPEALQHGGATSTSDLYSLGMVMLSMMLASPHGEDVPQDPGGQQEVLRTKLPAWPKHQAFCFAQLLHALLHQDWKRRGFFNWTPSDILPHRLVLCHPFFWSASTGLRFLVTLGTYNSEDCQFQLRQFKGLEKAVQEAVSAALLAFGGKSWFDVVADLETGSRATMEDRKSNPFGLLKFICNKSIQLNDGMDLDRLQRDPEIFQKRFPELVARCWEALLENSINIIRGRMEHTRLREFFERPIDLESFRAAELA